MKIVYNHNEIEIKEDLSLKEFVDQQNFKDSALAAAVDDTIVPKKEWADFILKEGMNLDIFNLVAGG